MARLKNKIEDIDNDARDLSQKDMVTLDALAALLRQQQEPELPKVDPETLPIKEIEVKFNKPQSLAYNALKPGMTVACPWGRGVGKSKFQRLTWYLLLAEHDGQERRDYKSQKGIRIVLLAPTFKQAVDVHGAAMEHELKTEWAFLKGKLHKTKWRVDFPGGSSIQFFGAENADAVRGVRCDYVTVDECDDVDPDVFDAIVQPWLSEPWSLKMRLCGGTPRRGRHGLLYKLWDLGKGNVPGHYAVHATYKDAPENISQEFVEQVRKTTPQEIFKREWECDFDSAEGLVYSNFIEAYHVRQLKKDNRVVEHLIGVDHGWEDPGVIVVIAVLGKGQDSICWAIQEVYESRRDTTWWIEVAKDYVRKYPQASWYLDPSRPDRIEDFRKIGARVCEVDNTIDAGVAALQNRLTVRESKWSHNGAAKLYVSPDCRNLIREFGLYKRRRNPKNRSEVLESIEDKHNHALDALRYAVYSRFGMPQTVRAIHNLPSY